MARDKLDPATLLRCDWRELRTELVEWDDCEGSTEGYDGLTRYWCPDAVFEIFWVAEREQGDTRFKVYLTEDLQLAGFRAALGFKPSLGWKTDLANTIHWQDKAMLVLKQVTGTQLELFEE